MSHESGRRNFLMTLGSSFAASLLWKQEAKADFSFKSLFKPQLASSTRAASGFVSVEAPGVPNLPGTLNGNVREFHLTAQPVTIQLPDMSDGMGMRGRPVNAWGYNGSMIGPTMEAVEGETVRVFFTNNLSEPTTVHFHGIELPIEMDGVPDFSQDPVPPGGTFVYEFPLNQSGTYFYHSHYMPAKQVGLGMMGFFIIHPKNPTPSQIVDHDYAYFLHTWKVNPGSSVPDTLEMNNFNYFTMNGRVGNGVSGWKLPPMKAKVGERVRIRVTNLSMLTHPVHLHGHTFVITDLGGGFLPEHQQMKANTISVSSAEVRVLEFTARAPGNWMFHCHFTHHTMNDMDRPPLPGTPPMEGMGDMDMGGMATWIVVS
jgi:FtsP/CotA-like multicopper oxidase with cupredoxin domain